LHKDWRGNDCCAKVIFTDDAAAQVLAVTFLQNPPNRRESWFRENAHRLGIRLPF
jgi:hypothetical protein